MRSLANQRALSDMDVDARSVLITRAEPDASATAERIRALGHSPLIAPIFVLRTRPLCLSGKEAIAATLLTSGNAISACPVALHHKPAFAVGSATAARAMAAGFQNVANADGNAQDLAALVRANLLPDSGRLLLPTTVGQGLQLAAELRASGFRVLRRVAYEVVRRPDLPVEATRALQDQRVSYALFFSSESAAHFARLAIAADLTRWLGFVEAVSISERTGMALRRLPWRRICVATKSNQDAMLALLK